MSYQLSQSKLHERDVNRSAHSVRTGSQLSAAVVRHKANDSVVYAM